MIVIGAGLGGCAAALALKHHGHDVRICEKLASFRRLGDSLGLGENALKLLRRWGGEALRGALDSIGNRAEDMRIRRWHDGEVLATQPLADMAGRIGHRGDYHEAFLKGVRDAGIPIDMGREVVSIDEDETEDDSSSSSKGGGGDEYDDEGAPAAARPAPPRPSVTFSDGTTLAADVVVGADGIKSRAREQVLGLADAPRSSGYACYRAYFPGALLLQQDEDDDAAGGPPPLPPSSRELLLAGGDCVNVWIGRDAHLVQNTLRGGAEFNWIITRRLAGGTGTSLEAGAEVRGDGGWARAGDMADVRALVADLDPRAAGAVARTPAAALLDWVICYRDPLPAWVARGHRVVLLGDSCHPHLPTSAQGASQAVESAAVLAVCLALAGRGGIPLAVGPGRGSLDVIWTALPVPAWGRANSVAGRPACRRGRTRRCGSRGPGRARRLARTFAIAGTML